MKLLLTSNGFVGTPLENDFLELTDNKANLKIAIIPTAGDPIEWVPESEGSEKYIAKLLPITNKPEDSKTYEYFKSKGYDVVIADLKEDPEKLKEKLESVDVIEVGGGDANWLLDWAKKSKFGTYFKDLLDKGVVYIGTSAGSMLVTPEIGLTWWGPEKKWEDTDHVGFGVVDFVVVPHQNESDTQSNIEILTKRRDHLRTIINFPWRVYLLNDGQAIKVTDNNVEHIGVGTKRCID